MVRTRKAAVLDAPGPPKALHVRDLPIPEPQTGEALVEVKAFGLNRSELHTRLGLAEGVTFPRVLGIEATGTVVDCPGGELSEGQQVAALMRGMGRTFDGGYAEYTKVPVSQIVPFESELDWATIGSVPEMAQTAAGSLHVGLDVSAGETLLIRGGSSSVGTAAAVLAKRQGLTVISTTRDPGKVEALLELGIDHVLIDEGEVAPGVREIVEGGCDATLELIGTPTLPDSLRATRVHGTVCFTGMLSNRWTVESFYPIDYIPRGVRLTSYSGGAADLPASVLQGFLDEIAGGRLSFPIGGVFALERIAEAHELMEAGSVTGKLVGVIE